MSDHIPQISIVVPVYQEEVTLEQCIRDAARVLGSGRYDFEIVAVDDGSKDRSLQILRDLQSDLPQLRVVHHLYNRGYGAALRTGIRVARGEVVLLMDADGQHTAEDIPLLLEHLPPYDLVIGYRTANYRGRWYRNFGNRVFNAFSSWLANFEIKDLTSGFRAMRRTAVLHFLSLYPNGFSASATSTLVFLKAGYNVLFVPIRVQPRERGSSKVNLFKDSWRFLAIILRMIMLYDPMRIFMPLAGILSLLALAAWGLGIWAAGRLLIPNSATLLFLMALIAVLMGLLSSQIASTRIHYFGDESLVIYESQDGDSVG
jgi:glycosyltransferase involved in cell wall biosynthesis